MRLNACSCSSSSYSKAAFTPDVTTTSSVLWQMKSHQKHWTLVAATWRCLKSSLSSSTVSLLHHRPWFRSCGSNFRLSLLSMYNREVCIRVNQSIKIKLNSPADWLFWHDNTQYIVALSSSLDAWRNKAQRSINLCLPIDFVCKLVAHYMSLYLLLYLVQTTKHLSYTAYQPPISIVFKVLDCSHNPRP